MTTVNIQSTSAILQRLVNMVVARTELNDLNRGSAMLQLLGAVSAEVELCYLELANLLSLFSIDSANGEDLDALSVLYLPDAIRRKPATAAFGRGRFTFVEARASDLLIPAGAVLRNPSTGLSYTTTEDATIAANDLQSNLVLLTSDTVGEAANTLSNTITQIVSGGRGANGFSNLAVSGGRGEESDAELRSRIRRRVASLAFSTNQALEGRALEAERDGRRVISARIEESITDRGFCTLFIDDGTPVLDDLLVETILDEVLENTADEGQRVFFTSLFPMKRSNNILQLSVRNRDGAGNLLDPVILTENVDFEVVYSQGRIVTSPDFQIRENAQVSIVKYLHIGGLIEATQLLIEGSRSGDIRMYRAAGVVVEVVPAEKVLLNVAASIVVNDGFNRDVILTEVRTAISNYINTLGIGDDVIVAELIERAMAVRGMYDVTITAPEVNRTIAANEVARIIFDEIEVQ